MSSRLTLVVPGLVWPAPLTPRPAQDLQLPALSWLLGRGRRRIGPSAHLETELAHLFGLPADAPPLAALRRQGEAHAAASSASHWLCADPVHLSITSGNLLLGDFAADEIDAAEAAALVATLNEHYSDLGEFSAPSPTRWYLRLAAAPNVAFFNLDDTAGRPMQHFLPTGADARRWQRVLNEIQVALHDHPVNKAREAAGKRAVNSVWFWGNAPAFVGANNYSPSPAQPPPSHDAAPDSALRARANDYSPLQNLVSGWAVQTTNPVARGMARAVGIEPAAPDVEAALKGDALVVLDELAAPARHLDLAAWRAALVGLENGWFAPIVAALRDGRLREFRLVAPGDRCRLALELGPCARRCFWRRPLFPDDLPLPEPR